MNQLIEKNLNCPYCIERISVFVEPMQEEQQYIEDCQVCCCPIEFSVITKPDNSIQISAKTTND